MERIPILRMGPFVLITIQVDMHDNWPCNCKTNISQTRLRLGIGRSSDRYLFTSRLSTRLSDACWGRWRDVEGFQGRERSGRRATRRRRCGLQSELGMSLPGVQSCAQCRWGM